MRNLEVLFSPTEFAALEHLDLSATVCVVFDVLRATSSMVTALSNGAKAVIPVVGIPEALDFRCQRNDVLLAEGYSLTSRNFKPREAGSL
jgi:2-phosphosulfolactate phosphatase